MDMGFSYSRTFEPTPKPRQRNYTALPYYVFILFIVVYIFSNTAVFTK